MPVSPPANEKLPVVVWGNGGCVAYRTFLTEIASHGYIAISAGAPHRIGLSNPGMMTESIEWAAARAGRGRFATMDATRVVAAGQSCGGLEAYAMKNNSRVAALGIYDSGYLNDTDRAMTITKPVFYFLGGSSDVAYKNVRFIVGWLLQFENKKNPSVRSSPKLAANFKISQPSSRKE